MLIEFLGYLTVILLVRTIIDSFKEKTIVIAWRPWLLLATIAGFGLSHATSPFDHAEHDYRKPAVKYFSSVIIDNDTLPFWNSLVSDTFAWFHDKGGIHQNFAWLLMDPYSDILVLLMWCCWMMTVGSLVRSPQPCTLLAMYMDFISTFIPLVLVVTVIGLVMLPLGQEHQIQLNLTPYLPLTLTTPIQSVKQMLLQIEAIERLYNAVCSTGWIIWIWCVITLGFTQMNRQNMMQHAWVLKKRVPVAYSRTEPFVV